MYDRIIPFFISRQSHSSQPHAQLISQARAILHNIIVHPPPSTPPPPAITCQSHASHTPLSLSHTRGMLQNGEKTMSLWKGTVADSRKTSSGSHGSTEEAELFGLNPSGPATNNPDPKAISVTIRFESYTFPILYPSCSPQSRASLLQ